MLPQYVEFTHGYFPCLKNAEHSAKHAASALTAGPQSPAPRAGKQGHHAMHTAAQLRTLDPIAAILAAQMLLATPSRTAAH